MKRMVYCAITACLLVLCATGPLAAEGLWSVELRGGAALPTNDLGGADLNTGFGFEGSISYVVLFNLSGYVGWDWFRFTMDESPWGDNLDVEQTGYAFGLLFSNPVGELPLSFFLRAGGTLNHIELEDADGTLVGNTEHGLGWEFGGGLVYEANDHWKVTPGIRYRSQSRDLNSAGEKTSVDLNCVAMDVGISVSF